MGLEIPFWGFPIIRTVIFWGLHPGPPCLGNYYMEPPFNLCKYMCGFETRSLKCGGRKASCKTLPTPIVPLDEIEYGVYGDLTPVYPKPYSIYLRGIATSQLWPSASPASHDPGHHTSSSSQFKTSNLRYLNAEPCIP